MSIGLCFWILMLVWLVFGFYTTWPNWKAGAPNLLLFILLLLLGWKIFGPPIHG